MTLILRPLDVDNPPAGLTPQLDLRGIAIHWRAPQPASEAPSGRRRRRAQAPAPVGSVCQIGQAAGSAPWSVQRIAFHAVSLAHADDPPASAAEQERFVRDAYVLAAGQHPIPSDAEIVYEIHW